MSNTESTRSTSKSVMVLYLKSRTVYYCVFVVNILSGLPCNSLRRLVARPKRTFRRVPWSFSFRSTRKKILLKNLVIFSKKKFVKLLKHAPNLFGIKFDAKRICQLTVSRLFVYGSRNRDKTPIVSSPVGRSSNPHVLKR